MTTKRVLVTGATGKVGAQLVRQLADLGFAVRALSKNPDTVAFPDGVEAVEGDLLRPESLGPALHEVDAVFLLWPAFDATGATEVVDAIAAAVPRIVYLSAMPGTSADGTEDESPSGFWFDVERAIQTHDVEWTFLRAGVSPATR